MKFNFGHYDFYGSQIMPLFHLAWSGVFVYNELILLFLLNYMDLETEAVIGILYNIYNFSK